MPQALASQVAEGVAEERFELFRRAVCERDDQAWETIVALYSRLVLSWIHQQTDDTRISDDADYCVNRAFERYWTAVTPERWNGFNDLRAVLQYLKLCAHSAVLDELRSRRRREAMLTELGEPAAPNWADDRLAEGVIAQQLWHTVLSVLTDREDRLVAKLSLVQGCSPVDIFRRYPGHFAAVEDVYRIKRNLLERLRRSKDVRDVLLARC